MFRKRDPVCGVRVKNTKYTMVYGNRAYYFDCQACKTTFEEEPQRFAKRALNMGFFKWLAKRSDGVPKSCHEIKK